MQDGNCNRDKNFNRSNYGRRNGRSGPNVQPQNREVAPRDGGGRMARVDDMMHKLVRRFDKGNEHTNELRNDLAGIWKKVDKHAISIKHLELQMDQFSGTVNTRQHGTIPSNTVQNVKK